MSKHKESERAKVSIIDILQKKQSGARLKMMTAYDYPSAKLVDESPVDITLVGDSLAMVVLGHENTVAVTMDEMLHHCRAVARGTKRAFLVGDMPFLSYQVEPAEAVRNAGRFIKEGGMEAVKLEGGRSMAETIRRIVEVGIPVMGHIGLTPQTATKLGGYRVQGKTGRDAQQLLQDALALQNAGCFAIVLEAVTAEVAAIITGKLEIPTIGIGAGVQCDGQVLVYHDLLGLFDAFTPKFVKRFADLRPLILKALSSYCEEVDRGAFPGEQHSFHSQDPSLLDFTTSEK